MEGQTVETTDNGVTEVPAETPQAAEASPATEDVGGTEGTENPKSVNRYQKLASENKKYRQDLEQLNAKYAQTEGARQLEAWLKSDPRHLQFVLDLMQGKTPQQTQQVDPDEEKWSQLDPWVAQQLREGKEAKRMIQERIEREERERQETQARTVQENQAHLESVFEQKLKEDGFILKDGSFDQNEIDLLSDAVLSRATRIAENPHKITEQELIKAYEQVKAGTKAIQKRSLSKQVTTVPPSGSNKGSVPIGRTKETDEERVLRIAREL